jgi:hypothetical protein
VHRLFLSSSVAALDGNDWARRPQSKAGGDESAMNPGWILEKSAKKYVIEVIFTRGVGIVSVSAHREAI